MNELEDLVGDPSEQTRRDRELRAEVEVERRARQTGLGEDLCDCQVLQRVLREQLLGRGDDRQLGRALPAVLARSVARSRLAGSPPGARLTGRPPRQGSA
jgi:hypothetical protein